MFDDEPLTWFQENLLHGSGFENGKIRIYAASLNLSTTDLASFLKEEYGTGGRSIDGGFMDYNPKGIELRKWKEEKSEIHTWSEAAKEIKHLISMDRYLTDKEKNKIKEKQKEFNGLTLPVSRYAY
jgi:hypothetical protein